MKRTKNARAMFVLGFLIVTAACAMQHGDDAADTEPQLGKEPKPDGGTVGPSFDVPMDFPEARVPLDMVADETVPDARPDTHAGEDIDVFPADVPPVDVAYVDVPPITDAPRDVPVDRGTPDAMGDASGVMPASCEGVAPAGFTRQLIGQVIHAGSLTGTDTRDLTHFESLFGFDPSDVPSQPLVPFPGWNNVFAAPRIGRRSYIAMEFRVPDRPHYSGRWYVSGSFAESASTLSVSTCPGDFRESSLPPGCFASRVSEFGLFWSIGSVMGLCPLVPGRTYYLNIKPDGCPLGACLIGVSNGPQG